MHGDHFFLLPLLKQGLDLRDGDFTIVAKDMQRKLQVSSHPPVQADRWQNPHCRAELWQTRLILTWIKGSGNWPWTVDEGFFHATEGLGLAKSETTAMLPDAKHAIVGSRRNCP